MENIFSLNIFSHPVYWLILGGIGFSVGILSGFFGVGGGWIITPSLNIFGLSILKSIGTSFVVIAINSLRGMLKHKKYGNVNIKVGTIFGVIMIIGLEIGKHFVFWLGKYAGGVVRWIYICMLMYLGLFMLYDYIKGPRPTKVKNSWWKSVMNYINLPPFIDVSSHKKISLWQLLLLGIFTGILAGLLGVGGGFLLIPIFIYLIGLDPVKAVGTSLLAIIFSGIYGSITYGISGQLNLPAAGVMLITAILGIQIGVKATQYINADSLKFMYALMLITAGISVLFKQLKYTLPSQVLIFGIAVSMSAIILSISYTQSKLKSKK